MEGKEKVESGGHEEGKMKEKTMIENRDKKGESGKEGRKKRRNKKNANRIVFGLSSFNLRLCAPRKLFRVCVVQYFD